MRWLVTGGCGFIGTNFIYYVIDRYPKDTVVNIDALTYCGNPLNLQSLEANSRYCFVKGNICDSFVVEKAISYGVDCIVNFAAESFVDRSIDNPDIFLETNVLGTQVLLKAAVKHNLRFHHISTDEVFGALGHEGCFNEESPFRPNSPYAASKAASDLLVRAFHVTYGLNTTITNCSNNYGPFQFPEKLIPFFTTNLIDGKKVPVYGQGKNVRDWLYVEDHCEAIDMVVRSGRSGETYCVGGNCEIANIDLTNMLLRHFSKDSSFIEYVKDRPGHDFRYAVDTSKIQQELGWKPRHDFDSGLRKTIDFYMKEQVWWRVLKEKQQFKEFHKKLYGKDA